jgi:hypothetical protein
MEQLFDDTFGDAAYAERTLMAKSVARAEEVAGPLEWDEMYGYEPALALGG